MNLEDHKEALAQLTVAVQANQAWADRTSLKIERLTEAEATLADSIQVTNEVLMATQGQAKTFIEGVVGQALADVYGEEYGFELEYAISRGASSATPWVTKGDSRYSPRDELGGGVLDICSLALRFALWALTDPRPEPVFVLDEPAKFLSKDLQVRFGQMLVALAKSLGIQIVLVSHSMAIIEQAERAYEVTQEDGVSTVKEIKT